jgi:two-component system, NtrC family, response regulator AtoC
MDAPRDRTLSIIGASTGSGYLLVVERGSSSVVPVHGGADLLVGRVPEADVRLADPACSRRHAHLRHAGVLRLEDLGSHNGTRLNGRRVTGSAELAAGDVITIGEAVIVVHAGGEAGRASPLLDARGFRQRLEEELERSIENERPLAVVALVFGTAPAPRELEDVLAAELSSADRGLATGDAVLLVLPESDPDSAAELAERCLRRLGGGARAGIASCPADGCAAEPLLASARAAAEHAGGGAVATSADAVLELRLGARRALVADPAMIQLYALLRRLADSDLPVLVTGETGAGKEHAAYALHAWSRRASRPFIAMNCAALQESLAESELFGHERGAFSGAIATRVGHLEAASGGTLFFDEIGELPLGIQAKLLRALETRTIVRVGSTRELPIDLRLVAATNRDLEAEVAAGRFRRDLYFRLGAARVTLPPLRDRARELALLARGFLDEARAAAGRPPLTLSAGAMAALARHPWPGNVRELRNEMGYLAATVDDHVVEPWHLGERLAPPGAAAPPPSSPVAPFRPLAVELRELECRRMAEALAAAGGVQKRAAELIRMPLRTFRMKAKQYGLDGRTRR